MVSNQSSRPKAQIPLEKVAKRLILHCSSYIIINQTYRKVPTMKLYAPEYYKQFQCIADKCDHSCCIGWEIDIDEETLRKYQSLGEGYGKVVKSSISYEGDPHFVLSAHDRCPHLDANGLCKIIRNLGEKHLCVICREHPRFYNFTSVAEVGIGMSCREAARVVLSSPHYAVLEEIGALDAVEDKGNFDGRSERSKVYDVLQDRTEDYRARLERIYRAYEIPVGEDTTWKNKIETLEYLNDEHKSLFLQYASQCRPFGKDEYLERSLAYFIYRHCTEALDAADFRDRLAFCLFCERLLASLIASEAAESLAEIATLASILSEEIEYSDENTQALTFA